MGSLKRGYAERVLALAGWPGDHLFGFDGNVRGLRAPAAARTGRTLVNEQHAPSEFMIFGGI
jgi:hypothetical protein